MIVLAGENTDALQGKEPQLHTFAAVWECAEGEGSFRWSGITETFVLPIKSQADVSLACLRAYFHFKGGKATSGFRLKDTNPLLNKLLYLTKNTEVIHHFQRRPTLRTQSLQVKKKKLYLHNADSDLLCHIV